MILSKDWEFNVLQIYDYKLPGKLEEYFDFISNNHYKLEGDICEVGVYRGFSILATAILLKELGSDKKVWGFDSFSGFPSYHENDDFSKFENLYSRGAISHEHFKESQLNLKLKEFMSETAVSPSNISTSEDFSNTSKSLLEKKIKYLELDNIILVDGRFNKTMKNNLKAKFMAVLMDCDLYESHSIALPFSWNRLTPGGYIYLDEYYSLKFPGARIATNEFFKDRDEKPKMYPLKPMDFERWYVQKNY
jgi:hypothetical protein